MCLLPISTFFKYWLISRGMDPRQPWVLAFDIVRWCLSVTLMILALNALGDALRGALDPRRATGAGGRTMGGRHG